MRLMDFDSTRNTESIVMSFIVNRPANEPGYRLERQEVDGRSLRLPGVLARPPEKLSPAAANGYFVLIKPLPPGRHVIEFGGVLPEMIQAVTYTVTVE